MKKTTTIMASCLAAAVLFSACGNAPAAETTAAMTQATTQAAGEAQNTTMETTAAAAASDASGAAVAGTPVDLNAFCESHATVQGSQILADRTATDEWGEIYIHADGTFFYHEWAVNEGNADPVCIGKFSEVSQIGDHIYALTIGEVNQEHPAGETWTEARPEDDFNSEATFVATDFDFLAPGTVFTVYDSGANKSDIPEELLAIQAQWNGCTVEELPDPLVSDLIILGLRCEANGHIFA